jgi:hypothetical protein
MKKFTEKAKGLFMGFNLAQEVKISLISYMETYSKKIGNLNDQQASRELRGGCTTGIIKQKIEKKTGRLISQKKLTKALNDLFKKGIMIKIVMPGSWSSYWPVGFAEELKKDESGEL